IQFAKSNECLRPKLQSVQRDKKPECRVSLLRQLRFSNLYRPRVVPQHGLSTVFLTPQGCSTAFLKSPQIVSNSRLSARVFLKIIPGTPGTRNFTSSSPGQPINYSQCMFKICTSRGPLRNSSATRRFLYSSLATSTVAST